MIVGFFEIISSAPGVWNLKKMTNCCCSQLPYSFIFFFEILNFCKDWAKHKLDCKEIRRRKEAEEAKAKEKIEPKKSKPDDEDDSDSDTESSTRRGQNFVN